MRTKTQPILTILTVCLVFGMTACKSKKALQSTDVKTSKAHSEVLRDVQKTQLSFTTLSAKTTLEILRPNSKSSLSSGAALRIVKGKGILISIRPFMGIEVAKLVVSRDSVLIVDRMNKQYLHESIEDLKSSKQIDFNYYNLESLLSNRLFYPGKQEVAPADYSKFMITQSDGSYLAVTKDATDILYNFAVDGNNHIISTLIYGEKKNYTLQCSYDKFIVDRQQSYPTELAFKIGIKDKRMDVKLSYSKLDIDKDVEIDYSVPNKYKKVSLDEVFSLLSKKL
ncbi:MAG: hypothetical protein BGN96_10370 [Bacteroidales bacterium 45-6]|nr:MAG: hypothetical protein BGN96_10370 [Bacteroidales bacterium 45-6]